MKHFLIKESDIRNGMSISFNSHNIVWVKDYCFTSTAEARRFRRRNLFRLLFNLKIKGE